MCGVSGSDFGLRELRVLILSDHVLRFDLLFLSKRLILVQMLCLEHHGTWCGTFSPSC
jgi:hypothetical protein